MKKEITGNIGKIKLEGRIDISNSGKLKEMLYDLKDKGMKKIIIDMDGLEYIDSSGLGRIFYFFADYKKENGIMEIHNVSNSNVKKVIEIVKLDKIITIK
ncbi:STAS domain-containing protein [Oceanotoga sp. DSM 15011]|jgi:anti-sigma B factor antagonist|uniref:Anti-sigma factor antagonist n=1 Tax=Oceanotoga teriensis TaxID=515440 RepID=A0AA45HID4_9BACT|nr:MULTISPECIES: STAS domain-containing protein [Oceanotoga]MDN5341783.1 anti-sigma factor antagonist [Oceanotoga sp.]PWJ90556.1 anti-sigma B factor antagonist [Oceanotoga teriensis]UYO99800.1 STAS domain-containing protein [Oceanotoga sp. DSM 15011]